MGLARHARRRPTVDEVSAPSEALVKAVRAGCDEMRVHVGCDYPTCDIEPYDCWAARAMLTCSAALDAEGIAEARRIVGDDNLR